MPIVSIFPTGSGGSGGGGVPLAAVSGIKTLTCHGKVYIKWTDPIDTTAGEATLAKWAGTLLVRKIGSAPANRRDGYVVIDSKQRDAYKDKYLCDSGLSDGTEYYYKFFPYSTTNTYTDDPEDQFTATPNPVKVGDITSLTVAAQLHEKVQLKWNDPAETVVTDDITLATWASTKVVYKEGGYPTSPEDGTLVENVTTRNKYSSSPLTVPNLTDGTTYYFALFGISTEGAINTNESGRITAVPNKVKITKVPTQKTIPTYSGSPITADFNDYDPAQLTIGGDVTKTDAGDYNATFTPKEDYCWENGTSEEKTVPWKINKAQGTMSIAPDSITLNAEKLSDTITVTRDGNGAITAESDLPIVTTQVAGNIVTVKSVDNQTGTAKVTIKVGDDKNYLAPESKECTVKCEFVPAKAELDTMDWADIRKVSDAGIAATYWAVGDAKQITVNGTVGKTTINQEIWAFILGFDHNKEKESPSGHAIHFQIGRNAKTYASNGNICFVDSNYSNYDSNQGSFTMNPGNSSTSKNAGGWENSHMRKTLLGSDGDTTSPTENTFMNALPLDLRQAMKSITKYSDNTGGGSDTPGNVTATTDYLFLLAEFEVQGTRSYANSTEQTYQVQYKFYENSNSKVFYKHNSTSSTARWWLRSVYASTAQSFCTVYTDGSAYCSYSGYSSGVAPGFCV